MLAQMLGMDVVAEGVETKEQLKILRDLKCEYGQGYYFSRPSNTSDAEKIIIETDEKLRKVYKPEKPQFPAPDVDVRTVEFFDADEQQLTLHTDVKTVELFDADEQFMEALDQEESQLSISGENVKTIKLFTSVD